MIYKILIKSKSTNTYAYYQVQEGTEMVDYETEYVQELAKTYKSLLAKFTTEQIKLVHELEPEIVINLEDETKDASSTTIDADGPVDDDL